MLLWMLCTEFMLPESVVAQDYVCPDETRFASDEPFTVDELAEIVGFSHPGLQAVADMESYMFREEPYFFFDLSCTPYNDTYYMALLFPQYGTGVGLIVYQVRGAQILNYTYFQPYYYGWISHLGSISGFADRNFNGLPDFYVGGSGGGSAGFAIGMRFLEINAVGVVEDITPVGGEYGPRGFDDINEDGIPELFDVQSYFVPTFEFVGVARQFVYVWWEWKRL